MNMLSGLALGILLFAGLGIAQASDEEKLKELERAVSAPSETARPKLRTRAIVFDNQAQAASSLESASATIAATGLHDCNSLPPDVRTVGVDFAIQFNVGSATVSLASEGTLNQIARVLALSPDRCVIVEGHTDSSGNYDRNVQLSRDRANSVVNFISSRSGIDRKRLVPVGKGPSEPMQNLDSRDPKNRRVVFKVVIG